MNASFYRFTFELWISVESDCVDAGMKACANISGMRCHLFVDAYIDHDLDAAIHFHLIDKMNAHVVFRNCC